MISDLPSPNLPIQRFCRVSLSTLRLCLMILPALGLLFCAHAQEQPNSDSKPNIQELVSHPAFINLVDDSLPWGSLSAPEFEYERSKPFLLFSPFRKNFPELNLAIRRALVNPLNKAYAKQINFILASPAWWPILDQRLVYSNRLNPQVARREFTLTSEACFHILHSSPEIEVLGFQYPGQNYQISNLHRLIKDIYTRYSIDPERIGLESRNARKGRFAMLEAHATQNTISVDISNLHANIGSILALASNIEPNRPSDYLQSIYIVSLANELDQAGEIGQSQRAKLFQTARKVLNDSWEQWEKGEFRMFVAPPARGFENSKTDVYSLGESCRILLLEKLLPGAEGNEQRGLKLLNAIEELFVGPDGAVSDQVTQLAQGPTLSTNWCQLHNRALLCQVRLLWRGKEADLSWLENAADLATDPENPRFPSALIPSFPGDPESLLGIIYVGQACLIAAEIHPSNSQLWINRSRSLFELFEKRFGAGEKGYHMLPKGHPLEVPPEAFFASSPDRSNSLLTQHGLWLRALEANGVAAAGQRADELLDFYTRWRIVRTPMASDLFFTRGIPLQKPLK